jgi:hypothetical protein
MKSEIQSFIKRNCATHSHDDKCLLETAPHDSTCVYFRKEDDGQCAYFENMVLPGGYDLYLRYWMALGNNEKPSGHFCERCNERYERTSNRQRFCVKCGAEVKKENRRRRDAKYRDRKRRLGA